MDCWWFSAAIVLEYNTLLKDCCCRKSATIIQHHIKIASYRFCWLKSHFTVKEIWYGNPTWLKLLLSAPSWVWLSADSAAVHPNRLSHPWHCLLYLRIKSWLCFRWHSLTAGSLWLRAERRVEHTKRCPWAQTIRPAISCRRRECAVSFHMNVTWRESKCYRPGRVLCQHSICKYMQRMCRKNGAEYQQAVG